MIFDHDIEGLLHISEISDGFIYNIGKLLPVGTSHRVKVIEVNQNNNFLKVSIKRITDEDLEKCKKDGRIRVEIDKDEINFTELANHMETWRKE